MAAQEKATHDERLDEIKKEKMVGSRKSGQKTERYRLTMPSAGVFAYCPKPGEEQDEPPHLLCTNCFTNSEKSILQFSEKGIGMVGSCPRCQLEIFLRHED